MPGTPPASDLASKKDRPQQEQQRDIKKARLAEQLRANLQRRKAQARSRRAGQPDHRPEGLAGSGLDMKPAEKPPLDSNTN